MKKLLFFLCGCLLLLVSCAKIEEPIVELQTSEGIILIKLNKETPLHRDNFVKLVEEGFFDGQIFHKVMKDVMMQAGDPNSREASRNRLLGEKPSETSLPAELDNTNTLAKGALVAVNLPEREGVEPQTDAHLFNLIIGRKYTAKQLDTLELDAYNKRLEIIFQKLVIANRSRLDYISLKLNDKLKLRAIQDSLVQVAGKEIAKDKSFLFTKQQREAYTKLGGLPEVGSGNTVFGQLIAGFEVLDKINNLALDPHARPQKDVRIIKASLKD